MKCECNECGKLLPSDKELKETYGDNLTDSMPGVLYCEQCLFVDAVLKKDGPDSHPDSMFAMKYDSRF